MNTSKSLTSLSSLPDQSAFFASLLTSDPDLAAYVTAAYGKTGTPLPEIKTTRSANVKGVKLTGIKPAKASKGRATGPGSRGGKVKEKAEKAPERPICALTLLDDGPGAAHFLSALCAAGERPRLHEVDGHDPVTGEMWSKGDPRLAANGEPIFYNDASKVRPDEAAAIRACFSGWDPSEAHGTMLDQARMLAQTAMRRDLAGQVVRRPFNYAGLDGKPRTVVNVVTYSGVVASAHPWHSPAAHSAKWSAEGYVKGLPRPIQKLLGDLSARERLAAAEMVTLGKLREFASEGDRDSYEALITAEYPGHSEAEPIFATDGITVENYTVVAKDHPVVQALKREKGSSLIDKLARLEAFAAARLGEIQKDLDGLDGSPDADTVARVYATMLDRGSVQTLEETVMTCYDHGSRSFYTLPVGTVIDAKPIEALARKRDEQALWLTK